MSATQGSARTASTPIAYHLNPASTAASARPPVGTLPVGWLVGRDRGRVGRDGGAGRTGAGGVCTGGRGGSFTNCCLDCGFFGALASFARSSAATAAPSKPPSGRYTATSASTHSCAVG